jgi:hypothetical protein
LISPAAEVRAACALALPTTGHRAAHGVEAAAAAGISRTGAAEATEVCRRLIRSAGWASEIGHERYLPSSPGRARLLAKLAEINRETPNFIVIRRRATVRRLTVCAPTIYRAAKGINLTYKPNPFTATNQYLNTV